MPDTIANRAFRLELYAEHLEEASFLYGHTRQLLGSSEVEWSQTAGFQDRLEAHIDALVVGSGIATQCCERAVREGDFGMRYAAVSVLCRLARKQTVLEALDNSDPADLEIAYAIRDALDDELPAEWNPEIRDRLLSDPGRFAVFVGSVCVERQLVSSRELGRALASRDLPTLAEMIEILGRVGDSAAAGSLTPYLKSESADVRQAAAFALLRLGDPHVRGWLVQADSSENWALSAIALSGGPSSVDWLLARQTPVTDKSRWCDALGTLGDVRSIETLLGELRDPVAAESAASALGRITGAEVKPRKAAPLPTARKSPGSTASGLPDIHPWQKWWRQNRPNFDLGRRYRMGKPMCPEVLLQELTAPRTKSGHRSNIFRELLIRYAPPCPRNTTTSFGGQTRALRDLGQWVHVNGGGYAQGAWYFSGRGD